MAQSIDLVFDLHVDNYNLHIFLCHIWLTMIILNNIIG